MVDMSFKFHLHQGILSTLMTFVSPNDKWHNSNKSVSNQMVWQWAETPVEIMGTLADIRGTTK